MQAHAAFPRGGAQPVGMHTHSRRIRFQPDLVRRTVDQVGDLAVYFRLPAQIPDVLILRHPCEPAQLFRHVFAELARMRRYCTKQVLRRLRRITDGLFADWDYGAAPGQHFQR